MLHSGPDEIGELATAFGAVHRQALRLAADQALPRMEVQAMFVALSRRGQTLVQRQIHLIDEFGRDEADPDALARLFALDHLAARMRRNEENLLVLAGGEPGRWITRPVAIVDLVRAAAQEIEEYRRVEVGEVPDHAIGANVAGDVIHLLAELLENATSYSPPSTMVRVAARRTVEGLVIRVRDNGIGMPPTGWPRPTTGWTTRRRSPAPWSARWACWWWPGWPSGTASRSGSTAQPPAEPLPPSRCPTAC